MGDAIEIEVDESLKVSGDATKLYEALAKASADFYDVPKTAEGQVGTSRRFSYADYATLMRCVRPALSTNGVFVMQPMHSRDNGYCTTTTIVAGHGARIQSSFTFKADANPQEFGRQHTYYRRYQLQAMLGLAGDSDADDAPLQERAQFSESAKEPAKKSEPKSEPKAAAPKAPAPAPAAAAPKPAPAPMQKPETSAGPSVPSTNGKAEQRQAPSDMKSINAIIVAGLKKLNWKVSDARQLYIEKVDPAGFGEPDTMTIEQKRALLKVLVDEKGIDPF